MKDMADMILDGEILTSLSPAHRRALKKKFDALERQLYQQKFNNKHNLSIDGDISRELERLQDQVRSLQQDKVELNNHIKYLEESKNVAGEYITGVEAQLNEANKVIEYYGDHRNWSDNDLQGYPPSIISDTEIDYPEKHITVGGKRARQYLDKYKAKGKTI